MTKSEEKRLFQLEEREKHFQAKINEHLVPMKEAFAAGERKLAAKHARQLKPILEKAYISAPRLSFLKEVKNGWALITKLERARYIKPRKRQIFRGGLPSLGKHAK